MIITCRKKVPWSWVVFMCIPFAAGIFCQVTLSVGFVFTLSRYVDDPGTIGTVVAIGGLINMVCMPVVSLLSDRIWTRYGRRRPFIIISSIGIAAFLLAMPMMNSAAGVIACYLLATLMMGFGGPYEPLKQEVIPPPQRGRATAIFMSVVSFQNIIFWTVMLGRFDDIYQIRRWAVTGEQLMYWMGGIWLLVMLAVTALGVKEETPKSEPAARSLSFKNFFSPLLDRNLWMVYTLTISTTLLGAGLGPLGVLLMTDQWGYSKQEMGNNVAIAGTLNIFLSILVGTLADRFSRIKLFLFGITTSLLIGLFYFSYVMLLLPDQRPSLVEQLTFGEMVAVFSMISGTALMPLMYDYIPRNSMGTFIAGKVIVGGLVGTVVLLLVTNFVSLYAWLWMPPPGEMVRMVLSQNADAATVGQLVSPAISKGRSSITVYDATGRVLKTGRAWEIRQHDPALDKRMQKDRKRLDVERSSAMRAGDKATADARGEAIAMIDRDAKAQADAFASRISEAVKPLLAAEGSGILATNTSGGIILCVPAGNAKSKELTAFQQRTRELCRSIVNLNVSADGTAIEVGVALDATLTNDEVERNVLRALREASPLAPRLLPQGAVVLTRTPMTHLRLDLDTIEEPVPTFISPVTRLVNVILGWFDATPRSDIRLLAMAKGLCETSAVRIAQCSSLPGRTTGFRLDALLPAGFQQPDVIVSNAIEQATAQRLTVVRPLITAAYAPQRYNYYMGYIFIYPIAFLGLILCYRFAWLDKKGLVPKRGLIEYEA